MSYEQKYLKYKNKYLNLQSQIGGAANNIIHNNNINAINILITELNNYIDARNIRDFILERLQANMGGQIPFEIMNYPNDFNNNMIHLCNRFFNLFNNFNNFYRDDLVTKLLNLNYQLNNNVNIINH